MKTHVKGETVYGVEVDAETRCAHYFGKTDVVAIKFHCCNNWYPCHTCHQVEAGHDVSVWPKSTWEAERVVLCGVCGHQLTVNQYLTVRSVCPNCRAAFNPGCQLHHHLYFEPLD